MPYFRGKDFSFELGKQTYIMGILNVTPDSFSDGGNYFYAEDAISRAICMQNEGANIIDIGGQSTRPNCQSISVEEELSRIIPVLDGLMGKISIPISIDTFYPEVAIEAISRGASIINDVTSFCDKRMIEAAASNGCGVIVMHNGHGTIEDIRRFFAKKSIELEAYGLNESNICFDAGIGFGKNENESLEIIKNTAKLKFNDNGYISALSRKRVIGYPLGNPPFKDRLFGTVAANTVAQLGGADFLRVHDVKAAVDAARVTDALMGRSM